MNVNWYFSRFQVSAPPGMVAEMRNRVETLWGGLNSICMPRPSWNESYAFGQLPWDTGEPEPVLVEFVTSGRVRTGPTLEISAGTRLETCKGLPNQLIRADQCDAPPS